MGIYLIPEVLKGVSHDLSSEACEVSFVERGTLVGWIKKISQ